MKSAGLATTGAEWIGRAPHEDVQRRLLPDHDSRRIDGHPHDRLGVARPDVNPAIVPLKAQSVAAVGFGIGPPVRNPVPKCRDRGGGIACTGEIGRW